MTWIDLATENATLDQLGRRIFEDLYNGWAKRRNFSSTPTDNIDVPDGWSGS